MIKRRTVLVLGAGTSASYGFPLGGELVDQAIKLLNPNAHQSEQYEQLQAAGCSKKDLTAFRNRLREARPPSIDVFLRRRPEFNVIGKRVIAALLIPKENEKVLRPQVRDDEVLDDWLPYFFERIIGHSKGDLRLNNLTVVSFNFDRLFEWALFATLQRAYDLSDAETGRLVSHVRVVHVYGSLGPPAWLDHNRPNARYFEPTLDAHTIDACANSIGIIGDEIDDTCRRAVEDALRLCEQVCFLGFSYHEMNVSWLRARGLNKQKMFGTALNMELGERSLPMAMLPGITLGHEHYKTLFYLRHSPLIHEPMR